MEPNRLDLHLTTYAGPWRILHRTVAEVTCTGSDSAEDVTVHDARFPLGGYMMQYYKISEDQTRI